MWPGEIRQPNDEMLHLVPELTCVEYVGRGFTPRLGGP